MWGDLHLYLLQAIYLCGKNVHISHPFPGSDSCHATGMPMWMPISWSLWRAKVHNMSTTTTLRHEEPASPGRVAGESMSS